MSDDRSILRSLASRYAALSMSEEQERRRALWRRHNSLEPTPVLIYVRAYAWCEMPQSQCECEDLFLRHYEDQLRQALFRASCGDDFVFDPWLNVQATWVTPKDGIWGLPVHWTGREYGRAGRRDPPIKEPDDIDRLVAPHHVIDETETARRVEQLTEAVGDLIPVNLDRAPAYRMWNADISTQLAALRGLEQVMWDMVDRPAWLHHLLSFMRDGILQTHQEAEAAGDWTLSAHQNQSMPFAQELDDPAADGESVSRDRLWTYCASQELTAVGPRMFDEFMLQYQIPIVEQFGLTAYGCCEDLTHKIDVLRQIPNLRRIGVAPAADVPRCAEQIGTDYVVSYRPSPADMVAYGLDPDRVRDILSRDLSACRGCHLDITLKDVETVQGDPTRIRRWVDLTRRVIAELGIESGS